ncbi:MAG: galactose mutarotase [Clostridia bacterium]|nr:galactose mutarotase [Clostridia bacterium]
MSITKRQFGFTRDGREVTCFIIASGNLKAEILDYGVTIRSLFVPDKNGKSVDVVLGYDTVQEYEENDGYLGATIGRVGNRIRKGKFTLNGENYTLAVNNGPNHLHGGLKGFDKAVWKADEKENSIVFSHFSPDGDEGYPGNLSVTVTVTLEENGISLDYAAETDKDTVINLTNHSYFNLNGKGDVLEHTLKLNADKFNVGDSDCLPTGEIASVFGTVMDFTKEKTIGFGIDSSEPCVKLSGGYDSNFILSGSPAAVLKSEESGIEMTVLTTEPGVQVYSANFLTPRKGKNGAKYTYRNALCLETQHFPDSIHHPEWPTCILKKGEKFESKTTYCFNV